MTQPVHVPRASEITGHLSASDLAAEREWSAAARRRRDLKAALLIQQQAKSHFDRRNRRRKVNCGLTPREAFQRLARETRSA